jgi:hypothetical protein
MDFGVNAACHLYAQYARSLALRGFPRQARTHLQFALERAHALQHLPTIALTMMIACTTSWSLRDHDALRKWSDELVRMASDQGYGLWHARGLSGDPRVYAALDGPADLEAKILPADSAPSDEVITGRGHRAAPCLPTQPPDPAHPALHPG